MQTDILPFDASVGGGVVQMLCREKPFQGGWWRAHIYRSQSLRTHRHVQTMRVLLMLKHTVETLCAPCGEASSSDSVFTPDVRSENADFVLDGVTIHVRLAIRVQGLPSGARKPDKGKGKLTERQVHRETGQNMTGQVHRETGQDRTGQVHRETSSQRRPKMGDLGKR